MKNFCWCFCQNAVLTVVWKTWYTCDTLYRIQRIIANLHSAPTKVLLRYVGLHNHDNDQTNILYMDKKGWRIHIFIETHNTFIFIMSARMCLFLVLPVHLKVGLFHLTLLTFFPFLNFTNISWLKYFLCNYFFSPSKK